MTRYCLAYKVKLSDAKAIMDYHLQGLEGHDDCTIAIHKNVIKCLLSTCTYKHLYLDCAEYVLLRWMIADVKGKGNQYAANRFEAIDRYIQLLCKHKLIPDNPLRKIKRRNTSPSWLYIVTAMRSPRPLKKLRSLRSSASQRGPLYCHIQKYIELQQSLGRKYAEHYRLLCHLDTLLIKYRITTPCALQADHIYEWLQHMHCNRTLLLNYVSALKRFIDYLIGIGVMKNNCAVSVMREFGRPPAKKFRPVILTKDQMTRILKYAKELHPTRAFKLRPQVCHTMLILHYALGLRSKEVRNLRFCDVDMYYRMLRIEETKFYKSRLVPFGPLVQQCLEAYMSARRKIFLPIKPDDPLFIACRRYPICSCTVAKVFKTLAKCLSPSPSPLPRIHDLRHTFAVHRLLKWYREGDDVQSKLIYLSAFMGHTEIYSTEVYLTITLDLLKEANTRFYENCGKLIGKEMHT